MLWLAILAGLLALDPYDTGRFALLGGRGVPRFGQRLVAASLARAPAVDAAIIGNSTIQLVDPARLAAESGLHVVSLAVPGTGPLEQLAVAGWLRRRHSGSALRAIVLGIDAGWCRADGRLAPLNPFPFWLYGRSRLGYALHMMRLQSLDHAGRKLKLLLGWAPPAPADGYNDYDTGHAWDRLAFEDRLGGGAGDGAAGEGAAGEGAAPDFAALPLLTRFLGELSPQTAVLLVFPPRYRKGLPPAGTAAARRLAACKAGLEGIAAGRPRTSVLDFAREGEIADREANFWDAIHYRSPVARAMEGKIAPALLKLMPRARREPATGMD